MNACSGKAGNFRSIFGLDSGPAVFSLRAELRVSNGWDEARRDLCAILGEADCRNRLRYDTKTRTVSIDGLDRDLGDNEGARLLNDLIQSRKIYDLSYSSAIATAGGQINVNHIENLDPHPDWRFGNGKGPLWMPAAGVDGQVVFNWGNVTPVSDTLLLPALRYTVVFHELAEAFAKIEKGLPYMFKGEKARGAHQDALEREKKLRKQRPDLYRHNIGSGPGTNYELKQRQPRLRK